MEYLINLKVNTQECVNFLIYKVFEIGNKPQVWLISLQTTTFHFEDLTEFPSSLQLMQYNIISKCKILLCTLGIENTHFFLKENGKRYIGLAQRK